MNEHEAGDAGAAEAAGRRDPSEAAASSHESAGRRFEGAGSGEVTLPPSRRAARDAATGLPVVLQPMVWDERDQDEPDTTRFGSGRRWLLAAATLAFAAVSVATAVFVVVDRHRQADLLAARARENATLEQTVSALSARLQAVETTRGRDELAEVRRSVGDIKAATAASRELGAAIAQLSQRVEKLDREQGAKLDRVGQRVDQETTSRTTELAARLDRPEKKPAPAATDPAPPPASPKFNGAVSMDPTGSIERPRQALRGYVVLGARDDIALIGGRYGERAVRTGDILPGAGRVLRVERQGPNWVVVTDQGLIPSARPAPN